MIRCIVREVYTISTGSDGVERSVCERGKKPEEITVTHSLTTKY